MDATARRRWLGILALGGALALLILGETLLKRHLGAFAFLIYWMVCVVLTVVAILIACLDLRAVQFRSREEQRRLLENTLDKIQADARERRGGKLDIRNLKDGHSNGAGDPIRRSTGQKPSPER